MPGVTLTAVDASVGSPIQLGSNSSAPATTGATVHGSTSSASDEPIKHLATALVLGMVCLVGAVGLLVKLCKTKNAKSEESIYSYDVVGTNGNTNDSSL